MFKERGKIEYLFYVLNRKYEIVDFENCKLNNLLSLIAFEANINAG